MSKIYISTCVPNTGDTIEFLKDLLPEDREEFLFSWDSEEEAINGFLNALPSSYTYTLKEPQGKILAMGGCIPDGRPGVYRVWLLCARGVEKYPVALYRAIRDICRDIGFNWLTAIVYKGSSAHRKFVERIGFIRITNTDDFCIYAATKGSNV